MDFIEFRGKKKRIENPTEKQGEASNSEERLLNRLVYSRKKMFVLCCKI